MLTVVVDTNLFLQCKPLQDINWMELDPGGVRVVVPMTVVKELDKAKSDGNGRRARRARAVVALFRKGVASPDGRFDIEGRPDCSWEFGSGDAVWHEALDRDLPDHRLLAEARHVAQGETEALLLSGDISVLVLAGRLALRAQELPKEWMLKDEPDERDKIVEALKAELSAVKADRPNFVVEVPANQAVLPEGIRFDTYRAPTELELDELMAQVTSQHPMAEAPKEPTDQEELLVAAGEAVRVTPNSLDFRQYRNAYPEWVKGTRVVLSALPYFWSARQRCVELSFTLRNDGSGPAFGVIVEYAVHDGAMLLPVDGDDREKFLATPRLPKPPAVPGPIRKKLTGYADIAVHPFQNFDIPEDRSRRHRYSFYRDEDYRTPVNRHVWECEELRHGKEERFDLTVLLPLKSEGTCALVCNVSARNAPPVVKPVTLRFAGNEVESTARLTTLLQRPKPKKPKVTLRLGPTGLTLDDVASDKSKPD